MPSPTVDRLKKIEYQLLKDWEADTFSDGKRVSIVQGIVNAVIDSADQVIDSEMPTSILGVDLDWSTGELDDAIVTYSAGPFTIVQDNEQENEDIPGYNTTWAAIYTTAESMVKAINTEDGVPVVTSYTETDLETILADALVMTDAILS